MWQGWGRENQLFFMQRQVVPKTRLVLTREMNKVFCVCLCCRFQNYFCTLHTDCVLIFKYIVSASSSSSLSIFIYIFNTNIRWFSRFKQFVLSKNLHFFLVYFKHIFPTRAVNICGFFCLQTVETQIQIWTKTYSFQALTYFSLYLFNIFSNRRLIYVEYFVH